MRLTYGLVGLLLGSMIVLQPSPRVAFAQASPAAKPPAHNSLELAVTTTINIGANLFNNGDVAGCYRLYQGAIIGLSPSYEAYPETKAKVEAYLLEARTERSIEKKTFILRRALGEVLIAAREGSPAPATTPGVASRPPGNLPAPSDSTARAVPPPTMPARKTLWDRLGGEAAITPIVSDLIQAALKDPAVDFTRGGKYPLDDVGRVNLQQLIVQLVSDAAGGPEKYTGRSMSETHRAMAVTPAQYERFIGHLQEILKTRGVKDPEAGELVALLNAMRPSIARSEPTPAPSAVAARPPEMKPELKPAVPQPEPKPVVMQPEPKPAATQPSAKPAATQPEPKPVASQPSAKPAATQPEPKPVAAPPNPNSLWNQLGGEPGVTRIVRDLMERTVKNKNVDFTRGGKFPLDAAKQALMQRHIVEYISVKTGGPLKYTGRDMKAVHRGMNVTENQFDSMNADLLLVMQNLKYSQELIDELLTVLGGAFDDVVEKK